MTKRDKQAADYIRESAELIDGSDSRSSVKTLLKWLQEDLSRERMHMNFYLYHASAVVGLPAIELREFLIESAKGEMEHVLAFQDRLYGLGAFTPSHIPDHHLAVKSEALDFEKYSDAHHILLAAQKIEQEVVSNYTQRIANFEYMLDSLVEVSYMKVFYEDQLQDSYEDCERIRRLLATY